MNAPQPLMQIFPELKLQFSPYFFQNSIISNDTAAHLQKGVSNCIHRADSQLKRPVITGEKRVSVCSIYFWCNVFPLPVPGRSLPLQKEGAALQLRVNLGVKQGSRPSLSLESFLPSPRTGRTAAQAGGGRAGSREQAVPGRAGRVKGHRLARRPHARAALPCPGSPGRTAPGQAALP